MRNKVLLIIVMLFVSVVQIFAADDSEGKECFDACAKWIQNRACFGTKAEWEGAFSDSPCHGVTDSFYAYRMRARVSRHALTRGVKGYYTASDSEQLALSNPGLERLVSAIKYNETPLMTAWQYPKYDLCLVAAGAVLATGACVLYPATIVKVALALGVTAASQANDSEQ